MIKNDYILRLIEQMGDVLRKVLSLENSLNFKEGHQEIDNQMQKLGISRLLAMSLPADEIMRLLGRRDETFEDRCMIFSRLIQADAHVYSIEGKQETAHNLYQTSLGILTELSEDKESEKLPEISNRIGEVQFAIRESIGDRI